MYINTSDISSSRPARTSITQLEVGNCSVKSTVLKPRERFHLRSRGQFPGQHSKWRWRTAKMKTTMVFATSLLVITACALAVVLFTSMKHIGDAIYSPQPDPRRLTTIDTSDTLLHLDERYFFDGTHSDFAQQFYRRYLAGDRVAAITDTSDLTEVVNYVKGVGLDFNNLPAMLQQALVWDMGYVAAADLGYVKVYTKCGMRMSELQISRTAYRSAGCTEQRCSSPNGEPFYQSMWCSGYQMGNVSLCAATNGITPLHGAIWADGGTDDMVPVSEMQRHEWTDTKIDYTILAIHLSGDPNSYGKCVMPSMIVPCVLYDANTADENDWCSPEHGEIVPQWLELVKTGEVLSTKSSGWQKAALPVTITSLVLLLLGIVATFIFWRRDRYNQLQIEDFLDQKRAILGSRGSDEFSMMDDIDFILEAPGHSFIDKGEQTWVAWGQTPVQRKPVVKQSVVRESSDNPLTFEDISNADSIYLNEGSSHLNDSFRSPSKATTAGLTSFASGVTGSPRNTFTSTFTRQSSTDPASSSTSATMKSSLIEFQNDPVVALRRVPFVDISLVRQITAGAYGEVWLGRMKGDIVAVKKLNRDKRRQLHEVEVFAAEIQLLAKLEHPNVLGLSGVAWNTLENILLIMEYMPRGDLQHVLQYQSEKSTENDDEFSWASHKAKIARDICCGLAYLHSLKPLVVHRDLKSKNVLIGAKYKAKLSDFGVSRLRNGEETMTSGVGTAYWTAPEALAGHRYSEKADIYSLGVVLAELDTGELPFFDARTSDGDRMEAIHILSLVVSGELQPSFTLDCPEDVRKLALACLNPEPERRPSAQEIEATMASGYDVNYAALGLTPERFEAFKSVFSTLDKAHTGAISTKQLEGLCYKLGESFDDEELAVAAASLADPQTGLIHFATFLPWWVKE